MPGQEVVDRLDAYLDGTRRSVFIDVLEGKVRRARAFNNLLDDRVDGRVVPAFEAGEL